MNEREMDRKHSLFVYVFVSPDYWKWNKILSEKLDNIIAQDENT